MRLTLAVTTVAAIALLAACGEPSSPPAPAAEASAPVRTARVESAAVAAGVRAVGILGPRDELRLSFKVGGVVERVAVDAGDRVKAGQLLAVLKRTEVDAAVSQAAEAVEKSRRDLERARQLRADEVATQEQVEDLTTAYNVARSNLRDCAVQRALRQHRRARRRRRAAATRQGQTSWCRAASRCSCSAPTGEGWVVRTALVDRDVVRVNLGDVATVTFDAFPGSRLRRSGHAHRLERRPQTGDLRGRDGDHPGRRPLRARTRRQGGSGNPRRARRAEPQTVVPRDGRRRGERPVGDRLRARHRRRRRAPHAR